MQTFDMHDIKLMYYIYKYTYFRILFQKMYIELEMNARKYDIDY